MISFEQFITELSSTTKVQKPYFPGVRDQSKNRKSKEEYVRGAEPAGDHLWFSPRCKKDIEKFSKPAQLETRAFFKNWIAKRGTPAIFESKHTRTIGKWRLWVVEVRGSKPAIHLFFREGWLNVDKDDKDGKAIKGKTKHRIYAGVRAFEGYNEYIRELDETDAKWSGAASAMPTKTDGFNRLILPADLQRAID